jgi:two-component system LytT family sensor kinase
MSGTLPTSRAARRARGVALYLAAWLPLVGIYAAVLEVMSAGTMPIAETLLAAVVNLAAPALLGGLIWLVVQRVPWTEGRTARFLALHAALATIFAIAWVSWELLLLGPTGPMRPPDYDMWRYVLPWQALIGFILYGVIAGISYAASGVLRTRDFRIAAERSERLRAQAELATLRAHINPHFLFNTLHSVMQLQRDDASLAEEALERLADLFAYVLRLERHGVELVSLDEEWRFAQSYLWLEQMRMGDRLRIESAIEEEALACAVPPFTIQPLVENAVRHGIAPSRAGGTVRVAAHESGGRLEIEVSDDGIGSEPERPDDEPGLGERAVSRRLAARHGASARARVETAPGAGYRVFLSLPAEPVPMAHTPVRGIAHVVGAL